MSDNIVVEINGKEIPCMTIEQMFERDMVKNPFKKKFLATERNGNTTEIDADTFSMAFLRTKNPHKLADVVKLEEMI